MFYPICSGVWIFKPCLGLNLIQSSQYISKLTNSLEIQAWMKKNLDLWFRNKKYGLLKKNLQKGFSSRDNFPLN